MGTNIMKKILFIVCMAIMMAFTSCCGVYYTTTPGTYTGNPVNPNWYINRYGYVGNGFVVEGYGVNLNRWQSQGCGHPIQ